VLRAGRFVHKAVLVAGSVAALAAACTPSAPSLTEGDGGADCVPVFDAGCRVAVVGGGSSGAGTEGGATGTSSACPVNSSDSQCEQCENSQCCGTIQACAASTSCNGLVFTCLPTCTSGGATGPCVQSCESNINYTAGVALYDDIVTCVTDRCPVCNESGAGDPCAAGNPACIAPFTCNGSWCTKPCAVDADCLGLGAGSGNVVGTGNVCVDVPGTGSICVPACSRINGCASYPGTFCQTTAATDGATVQVCALLGEGG
jgi:hypothetical protein